VIVKPPPECEIMDVDDELELLGADLALASEALIMATASVYEIFPAPPTAAQAAALDIFV
jgi:hypothetical protein